MRALANLQGQPVAMEQKARIYQPPRNTMQSGRANTHHWVLEYEAATARTPEPLMGWTSSGDTLNQVRLSFPSSDDAIRFAEAKGLPFDVEPPHARKIKPRNYADNFKPDRIR